MASICAKFHCHTFSSLENTKVGHFCLPIPQIKYATPDTPNKIGLTINEVRHINPLKLTDNVSNNPNTNPNNNHIR